MPSFDLVIMTSCFLLAAVPGLDAKISITEFFSMRIKVQNFLLFSGLLVAWHLIFSYFGLYESRRYASGRAIYSQIIKATTAAVICVAVAKPLFHINMVNGPFLLAFWMMSSGAVVGSRVLIQFVLKAARRRGRNLRYVLVAGTNPRAIAFANKIESSAHLGYRIIGFADHEWSGLSQFRPMAWPLVCDLDGLPEFIRNNVVDEIVIGLPLKSFYFEASKIAAVCETQGIVVRFLLSLFDMKLARSKAEEFEDGPLITLYTGRLDGWSVFAKRALDFLVCSALLVLLGPLFLAAAILIKLTSPGPVFFVQERLGLNKRIFRMYKLRTMVADAEQKQHALEHLNEARGPVFKIKNDPRITPVGSLLRKSSIDELPQIFNVLKGDMSLVGPRPLPVRDYRGFDRDWHRRRFSVRPGITCLWQVSGRSSISFEQWMELDMQYIDHWSLWLDLRILAGTIPAVLKGSGAV